MRAVVTGIILALTVGLFSGCSFFEERRHRQMLRAVDAQIETAMRDGRGARDNPTPFLRLDEANARWEILRAIKTALFNELWYPRRVSQPKLRAVVERLEATQGKDFDTVQGCLTIMDLLEEACPTARDYVRFADIHEAQAAGNIPKLERRTQP